MVCTNMEPWITFIPEYGVLICARTGHLTDKTILKQMTGGSKARFRRNANVFVGSAALSGSSVTAIFRSAIFRCISESITTGSENKLLIFRGPVHNCVF